MTNLSGFVAPLRSRFIEVFIVAGVIVDDMLTHGC